MAYEQGVDGEPLVGGWWAKGRVIASRHLTGSIDTNELIELAPAMGGTPATPVVTVIETILDSFNATVWSVVDASIAIVVAYSNGELHTFVPQTDTAGGAPVLTIRGTTPMPTSEVPYMLGYGSGKLIILTTAGGTNGRKRAYTSEVLDERFDFVVGQLQLIREWATTSDVPDVRGSMASTRNTISWLINDLDSGECELWGYDVISTGIFRESQVGAAQGISLSSYQNRFGLLLGDEVWARDETLYHASGYLITPNINFGRTSPLAWVSAVVNAENLGAAKGTISLWRSTDSEAIYDSDHPSWTLIGNLSDVSQSSIDFVLTKLKSEQLALKLEINGPAADNATPRLLRYSLRGITTARDWIVSVPVNVSDLIEVPYRRSVVVSGWGEAVLEQLVSLEGQALNLTTYVPFNEYQGIIDEVIIPVDYLADKGSSTRVAMVVFRGKRTTKGGSFTGTNSWAQTLFGMSLWATGEGEVELV
jgi:hypothetical protein